MDNKLEKLRKLRSLSEDTRATLFERELAYKKYVEYKNKYSLDDTKSQKKFVDIKVDNQYETYLLHAILGTFNLDIYHTRNKSRLRFYFYATDSEYLAVKDEFEHHRLKLTQILEGTTVRYLHSQVIVPVDATDDDSSPKKQHSDEFLKAYFGNSWLDRENYKNKFKKILGEWEEEE